MFFQLQSAAGENFTVSDVRNAIFLKEIDDLLHNISKIFACGAVPPFLVGIFQIFPTIDGGEDEKLPPLPPGEWGVKLPPYPLRMGGGFCLLPPHYGGECPPLVTLLRN